MAGVAGYRKGGIAASLVAASAWVGASDAHAQTPSILSGTLPGTEVVNVATVSYDLDTNVTVSFPTNEAVFVVEAPATPIAIEFFRYAPTSPDAVPTPVNGSDFSPSGDRNGPFGPVGAALNPGGQTIDISQPVPLLSAESFLAGEALFVRVEDTAANLNGQDIDTTVVTVTTDSGDTVTLRLYETGPNTGVFFAYINTTPQDTPGNDAELSTPDNTNITGRYQGVLSATEVVIDTALVDPLNRVFSTATGEMVSGATITLVDAVTGVPVESLGIDGFSVFPATQTSGETVSDSSGLVYEMPEGAFRFPHVPEGQYAIRVDPPDDFTFASTLDPTRIQQITDGAFILTPASFGDVFTVDEAGALRFDIPLDPQTDLVVTKTADSATADVGDYIAYTVTVENAGSATVPLRIHDLLPRGFRYVPGTTQIEREPASDPEVAATATELTFDAGLVRPGESVSLRYALLVGPGAHLGDAVNRAQVVDTFGAPLSNVARAQVTLREDLLRSTSTIIGRVSEDSCDADEDWAREIRRGLPVEGVRLYTETGAYAVTDEDGLYHFEGITEGVHVVQVDLETLPEGYSIMPCEESTQYAGRAFSKFVDVQGGGIWRANFYLERTGEVSEAIEEDIFDDQTEYKAYGADWIETQTPEPEIVYPAEGRSASITSVNLGIKHGADETIRLSINGREIPESFVAGRIRNIGNSVTLTQWRGLDILTGGNTVVAEVLDANGRVVRRLEREVAFAVNISRAHAVPDLSTLVADGYSTPKLAVRLEDEAGRPIHKGRIATVDVDDPYLLYDPQRDLRVEGTEDALVEPFAARAPLSVGNDGILVVPLEPTLRTGKVNIFVTLDNGRQIPLSFYLEPEKRDWIVVGLAEGTVGFETVSDKAIDLDDSRTDEFTDGRVAFFAKGLIKGEWLMTLAVDTDKRRSGLGNRDGSFVQEIDPNAYYTLYGDRSYQEFEALSRYPVFVKLEKRQGYALFGDYDTNVLEGRLTAYNRRLSGLKAEYVGEDIQVLGFAAETNQAFGKDEIAADGTSGTYRLSNTRILPQSEEIVIETRDRVRPDIVLDRRVMVRYLDYTLDYFTGELIFRLPVDATDPEFNPNVIVVDYETSEDVEQNLTFGGRAQVEFANDRIRVGVTGVHEDGAALAAGAESSMIGVDIVAQASDNTEMRAEYAVTDNDLDETAEAVLAEIIHTSEDLQLETYYRREEGGFGLGQRNSNTNGVQRYGVRADYRVSRSETETEGTLEQRFVSGAAYREDNLDTGSSRSNLEITARHDGARLDVLAGVRITEDNLVGQEDRQSLIATATATYALPDQGATLTLSHEQPLGGDADEVSVYPARTVLGVDKTVSDWAVATLRHEFVEGAQANAHNTALGLNLTPWRGGQFTLGSDVITQDSTRRIGATVGLDQTVPISDRWSASAGVRSKRVLDSEGEYIEVAPDAAISPFERNEDFDSGYVGVAYRSEAMSASARLEARSSTEGDAYIASAGVAREISETLSLAGAARGFISEPEGSSRGASRTDIRLGAAWRPRDEGPVVYNRLDWQDEKTDQGRDTTKIVNNLAANTMVDEHWQLTANWGAKYTQTDLLGQSLDSWSHLLGAETRYDLRRWLDVGARAQVMTSSGSNGLAYSWGPSIGVSPVENLWLSLGYNVQGFKDDDFEAAEYSRKGPYLQIRFKFDQESARGLLRRISPASTHSEASRAKTVP